MRSEIFNDIGACAIFASIREVIRCGIPLLALLLAIQLCSAQPKIDSTWLQVEIQNSDGTPCSSMGSVSLSTLLTSATGQLLVPDGNIIPSNDSSVTSTDLSPGPHIVSLLFNDMDFSDGPKNIDIAKGANFFTWKLPPLAAVDGELLLGDKAKTKDDTLNLQCYMTVFGKASRTYISPIKVTDKGYHLELFPGQQYTTLLLSDRGYAMAVYNVVADGTVAVPAPLPLLPGGSIKTRFVDKEGNDLKVKGKIQIIPKINNRFKPVLAITTDENGIGTLPYILPPSSWMLCDWGNEITGYTPLPNEVKISDKTTVEMVITLVKLGK